MPRATRDSILAMLRAEGATDPDARRIVDALADAGLNPPAMRVWLDHPQRAYAVSTGVTLAADVEWRQVPTHAIESGRADAVIAAAEEFAAATPDERYISQTLVCQLDGVRRLTHGDPDRTAMVVDIARRLKAALHKEVHVNEVVQQVLSGSLLDGDDTRLIDWMLDERLPDALATITSGRIDPIALNQQDALAYYGW
jgi:hypothetical protein